MVRFRRRYRRRRPKVSKAWAKSKKGAKSQSKQILTLQKQINRLNLRTRDSLKYVQYQLSLNASVSGPTAGDTSYAVWNLIQPDDWEPIFQTKAPDFQDITPDKFRGRSIGLEFMAQLGPITVGVPALTPVTATMFVCSLRKEVAKQFVHDTQNGTSMIEGVHYIKTSMGTDQGEGMVFLNKGIFNIRAIRRFMVGGDTDFYSNESTGEPLAKTTNLKDNNYRTYIKLPYRNLIKDDGPDTRDADEPTGFKRLTIDTVEPQDQLYVFIFANSYLNQALSCHANFIITGRVNNN